VRQVVLENRIINSPFEKLRRQFRFDDVSWVAAELLNHWCLPGSMEIRDPWDAKNEIQSHLVGK
jgi:hypothetical protein